METPTYILVTGGAGYIGSHTVKHLLEDSKNVVVFDNLSTGHLKAIEILKGKGNLEFQQGDLRNEVDLEKLFSKYKITDVVHIAAKCSVNESMENPSLYFNNNVQGTINLLQTMEKNNINRIVFSSSCAVYGETQYVPVDENHPLRPTNPYGESKKISETIIDWYSKTKEFNYAILRYFNVCGADTESLIGDSKKPSPHLIQNAIRGALGIEEFNLTCPTVNTKDGTPIRDYVDVRDLANAHNLALKSLNKSKRNIVLNLGSNKGYSVEEIIREVENNTGTKLNRKKKDVRKGEYAEIYADYKNAKEILGWEPKHTLVESINSLKEWYLKNPNGFN